MTLFFIKGSKMLKYILTLGQLNIMYNRVTDAQKGLTEVPHATQLTLLNNHWSSTEYLANHALVLRPSDGSTPIRTKFYTDIARCFAYF